MARNDRERFNREPKDDLIKKTVAVNRVTKVVKGGRNMRFAALVVVGDGKGRVGAGTGKAAEVPEAIEKATKAAEKAMFTISTKASTIPHAVTGVFGRGKVLMLPAVEGTGVIAGGAVRQILEVSGIKDIRTKCIGTTNPINSVKATIAGLKALKTAKNNKVTWLLDGETLTDATLLAQIDKAVDQVKPLYRNKTMFVHADPDLVIKYSRAYREKYPWLKNQDGEKVKIDFTNFTFAPLEGMRGTGVFFITPKENFKHLMSRDPQRARIFIQALNYDVKVFAEWWEACGFWLAEAIFAYIPPEESGDDDAESSQGGGV